MYPIPPSETLVQTKTCHHCSALFPITDKDLEFYEKVSPVFNWKRYLIPTPTLCPDCRQQRRLSFRNERKLYKRNCDATGKSIISIYSQDKPFKVYHQDYWWSDKWDPMKYWRDFDFNKGFFEQFEEMVGEVPRMALSSDNTINCEFTNFILNSQNCYFLFWWGNSEDIYFSNFLNGCTACLDSSFCNTCELCYESISCDKCFSCSYCINCNECTNCIWCSDCTGCKFCAWCSDLENKEYYVDDIFVWKENYLKHVQDIRKSPSLYKSTNKHLNIWSENVTGNHIVNSKNCFQCWDIANSEDLKFCYFVPGAQSSYDLDFMAPFWSEFWYELCTSTGTKNSMSNYLSRLCTNIYYCQECRSCEYCFACIGLRNKSYCILNKQYTREEYETLVPRIIEHMQKTGEWGEFFPSSLSPFGYNETVAMEYYPLNPPPSPTLPPEGEGSKMFSFSPWGKEAWKADRGTFNWSFYEAPFPKVEKIIPADKLPDDISKIPDDILNWAIECEVTGKPFRIIKQELEFYRKHNLPIPRRHPDVRHADRMALRNPRKLFERKCDKCGVEMVTTYAPERKEIVYCESCYNAEVIG